MYENGIKHSLWLQEKRPRKVVILTDSLSALQALTSEDPDGTLQQLIGDINELVQTTPTILQRIPAHTGISGNEEADQLAKESSKKTQPNSHFSYKEARTLIKNNQKAAFHRKTGGYNPHQDALHKLTRPEQTVIFRLRTGHCGLKSHLKRIGIKPTALCDCGEADQTPQHFLQSCLLFNRERRQIWPVTTSMDAKLRGSVEELRMTTQYTALTELRI